MGVHKGQPLGVEQQARRRPDREAGHAAVADVDRVADDRRARFGEMDADLVGAACAEVRLAAGQLAVEDAAQKDGLGELAAWRPSRGAAAQAVATVAHEGACDDAVFDVALSDKRVAALDEASGEQALHALHGAGVVGEDHQPRRQRVEPMDQPLAMGESDVFAADAGGLVDDDDAGLHLASARGLVEHDAPAVDGQFSPCCFRLASSFLRTSGGRFSKPEIPPGPPPIPGGGAGGFLKSSTGFS